MREIKFRVWDKIKHRMFIPGDDRHDGMLVYEDGRVIYYNLKNGDGSGEDGGYTIMQSTRLRDAMGAGVPDVFLPIAADLYHGLFIEMKSSKGRTSQEQEHWLSELAKGGYKTAVCYSWIDAAKEIIQYLRLDIEL